MATFIGITHATAQWLLDSSSAVVNAIHNALSTDGRRDAFRASEFSGGVLRISGTQDGRLVAIWNTDYLTGTGEELWGFIKSGGQLSLWDEPSISRPVIERCLHVIAQRLAGLRIDSALIHRSYDNGAHTCLAGRSRARKSNIGYKEAEFTAKGSVRKAVVCVGPAQKFDRLSEQAAMDAENLPKLVAMADSVTSPARKAPSLDLSDLANLGPNIGMSRSKAMGGGAVTLKARMQDANSTDRYRTLGWTYEEWTTKDSPLTPVQRRILYSDVLLENPMRIVGPAGSGKTLLMQLLATRLLRHVMGDNHKLAYIVHNDAMADNATERFRVLGAQDYLNVRRLDVKTLSQYATEHMGLSNASIVDKDAHKTKEFQLDEIRKALQKVMDGGRRAIKDGQLYAPVSANGELADVLAHMIMAEISTAIKGHGLSNNRKKYVESERRLSRLHGVLGQADRELVFDVFEQYQEVVFEEYGVLDSDDIAVSLLARLRTPIWDLQRKDLGYDYVFVDETQLFNENERRIFPYLCKGKRARVPIALALDEAQELYGQANAGLGSLGIDAISTETLPRSQRCSQRILDLAFFVIQRTTDLFGADFPDFTIEDEGESSSRPLGTMPTVISPQQGESLEGLVARRIMEMRVNNIRQIAVVCHAQELWKRLNDCVDGSEADVKVVLRRGVRLSPEEPLIVLSQPSYVGGQEFDAVIAIGLEQGLVPPRAVENEALASALEQQALREMYLTFTRARDVLEIAIDKSSTLSAVLRDAKGDGLIV